jgi:hypothetical protein
MRALCAPHGGRICLAAGLLHMHFRLQQQETQGDSGMRAVGQICIAPLLNEATRSCLITLSAQHRRDVTGATLPHHQGIKRV